MIDTTAFETELNTDLAAEITGSGVDVLADVLAIKVKAVVRELLNIRSYENSGMTDYEIQQDINRYYTQCMNVSRYDYNQLGAEGEESHNENGISRKYIERARLWGGVVPFAKV